MGHRFFTPVLLVMLMASAIGLQALRERGGELPAGPDSLLYVRSPAALQRMALSYNSILADVYWIRAVQLYGDTKLGRTADRSYSRLYPLLELATTLDPYFDVAYQFGALFLAEAPPGGPGRPDLAIALFFSTFSSPFLSAGLTLGLWVIGHFNADLKNFEAVVDSRAAAWFAHGLYYVLPNFSAFDIKQQVVYAQAVPASYLATTALYGAVYIALLLAASVAVFSRRDFK